MDVVERFQIALRREGESDHVGSFCQSIMPIFAQNWDDTFGEDVEDEDIVTTTLKDFTIYKHLGFESSWAGTPGGHRVFSEESNKFYKKIHDAIDPEKKKLGYEISRNGAMVHHGTLNGLPYTYTHEGILKTEELYNGFYEGSYVTEPPENAVDHVNQTLKVALERQMLPIFTTHLISEPLISTISVAGAMKFSRKNPNFLRKVFDDIFATSKSRMEVLCQSEAPVVLVADDCAYKGRPMYSPKFYKEFILPYFKILIDMAHKKDKLVIFHSDGYVEPLYDLLISVGLDAHQSLEPPALPDGVDLGTIKEKYQGRLTLIGNMDCSRLLPYGTKDEVIAATKKCLKDGAPGGGFIFSTCTDLTNSCRLDNVITMMDVYKKYRDYPINI